MRELTRGQSIRRSCKRKHQLVHTHPLAGCLITLVIAACILCSGPLQAATIVLHKGGKIRGKLVKMDTTAIRLVVGSTGRLSVDSTEVKDIEFTTQEERAEWESQWLQLRKELAKAATAGHNTAPSTETQYKSFVKRFVNRKASVELRYPDQFVAEMIETNYFTFYDPRWVTRRWSFNLTRIPSHEAGFDQVVREAAALLQGLAGYRLHRQMRADIGKRAQHTTGLFDNGQDLIRHDQVIVEDKVGLLVLHFFHPGATLDDDVGGSVDRVLTSLVTSR